MIFSDPDFFLVFLPLCVAGFAFFGRFGRRSAVGFLAFMSLAFYAQWSRTYVLLLLGSVLFNYAISRRIAASSGRERTQTRWLVAGIAGNLSALGYFKYAFPFLRFAASFTQVQWSFGAILLPLGISFFTFTQIAYLVDLKQGAAEPEGLLNYAFFVTFFPHLIAGPILHHRQMMPQMREERRYGLNSNDVALGLTWFSMGMFKKAVIADTIAERANELFANVHHAGARGAWLGVLAYALQLYFDFSGYSDMALGLARIFSIRFPLNFNSPYKASNILEFWQRWHITLTHSIMSYVYTPLLFAIRRRRVARNKDTSRRVQATAEGFVSMIALPTLFTFFLAGVWHGAGLQFFAYGMLHGFYITVNHAWRTFVPLESRVRRMLSGPPAVLLTFLCAIVAFVLFRARGLGDAFTLYAAMLGLHGAGDHLALRSCAKYAVLLAVVWLLPNTQEILGEAGKEAPNWTILHPRGWRPRLVWWAAAAATLLVATAYSSASSTFLYFQF